MGNSQVFDYDEYGNVRYSNLTDSITNNTMSNSFTYYPNGRLWKIIRNGYYYEDIYDDLDEHLNK